MEKSAKHMTLILLVVAWWRWRRRRVEEINHIDQSHHVNIDISDGTYRIWLLEQDLELVSVKMFIQLHVYALHLGSSYILPRSTYV